LAGYRPLGLSSVAPSTIIAGRATSYADRRRAAAERLSKTDQISQRLDAVVEGPTGVGGPTAPIDPDGTLRSAIRALLPLAYRVDDFDVTVSLGPDHRWAARIRRTSDGVSAELLAVPAGPGGSVGAAAGPGTGQVTASEAEIAAELASLLWTGEVKAR
jgi:hypothetical protein